MKHFVVQSNFTQLMKNLPEKYSQEGSLYYRDVVEAIENNFFDIVARRFLQGRFSKTYEAPDIINYAAGYLYYSECKNYLSEYGIQIESYPVAIVDMISNSRTIKVVFLNLPDSHLTFGTVPIKWSKFAFFGIGIKTRPVTTECNECHPDVLETNPDERWRKLIAWNHNCFPGLYETGVSISVNGEFESFGKLRVVAVRGTQNNFETDASKMFQNVGAIVYHQRTPSDFDYLDNAKSKPEIIDSYRKAHWFIATEEAEHVLKFLDHIGNVHRTIVKIPANGKVRALGNWLNKWMPVSTVEQASKFWELHGLNVKAIDVSYTYPKTDRFQGKGPKSLQENLLPVPETEGGIKVFLNSALLESVQFKLTCQCGHHGFFLRTNSSRRRVKALCVNCGKELLIGNTTKLCIGKRFNQVISEHCFKCGSEVYHIFFAIEYPLLDSTLSVSNIANIHDDWSWFVMCTRCCKCGDLKLQINTEGE